MSSIAAEEFAVFNALLKKISSHLKWLLKHKPLIKREWDTDDFSQELSLKYFKNIIKIAHTLKSDDHRLNLLRKMANQIANDKLKDMQRKKRDVRKISNDEIKFIEIKHAQPIDEMCIKEEIDLMKSKLDKKLWQTIVSRSQGKSWKQCSTDIGYCSSAALRLRIKRHVDLMKNRIGV